MSLSFLWRLSCEKIIPSPLWPAFRRPSIGRIRKIWWPSWGHWVTAFGRWIACLSLKCYNRLVILRSPSPRWTVEYIGLETLQRKCWKWLFSKLFHWPYPKKIERLQKTPNTFNQRSTSVIIKQHLEESPTIFEQPNDIQKLQPSTSFQTSHTKSIGLDGVTWGMPPTTRSFIRFIWRNCKICVKTWGRGIVGFHWDLLDSNGLYNEQCSVEKC